MVPRWPRGAAARLPADATDTRLDTRAAGAQRGRSHPVQEEGRMNAIGLASALAVLFLFHSVAMPLQAQAASTSITYLVNRKTPDGVSLTGTLTTDGTLRAWAAGANHFTGFDLMLRKNGVELHLTPDTASLSYQGAFGTVGAFGDDLTFEPYFPSLLWITSN